MESRTLAMLICTIQRIFSSLRMAVGQETTGHQAIHRFVLVFGWCSCEIPAAIQVIHIFLLQWLRYKVTVHSGMPLFRQKPEFSLFQAIEKSFLMYKIVQCTCR